MNTGPTEVWFLARRVDALERADRRLRGQGGLALGLCLVLVLILAERLTPRHVATADERELEAQAFVARDRDGRARAKLFVDEGGLPHVTLLDAEGKVRVHLGVKADGSPFVAVGGKDGRQRAALGVQADESTGLVVHDTDMRAAIALGVEASGAPRLILVDKDGKPIFEKP